MAPGKGKLTEEERKERNKLYYKKYRNSVKEKQPNAQVDCKQYQRLKTKLQNSELYELNKTKDQDFAENEEKS